MNFVGVTSYHMNMKHRFILFILCTLNILGARAQQIDTTVVDSDCLRMVQFFKATLYENYGDSLAFDTFANAYHAYDENYILQVDRDKLKALFSEIYERTWRNYFLGGYDERNSRVTKVAKHFDNRWVRYSPGLRGMYVYAHNPNGYHQRVIAKSSFDYFENICEMNAHFGGLVHYPSYLVNNYQINFYNLDKLFRRGDNEVLLWLTFRFWPYLCHCANIDVYYGIPKEEAPDSIVVRGVSQPKL